VRQSFFCQTGFSIQTGVRRRDYSIHSLSFISTTVRAMHF
jgi:hypothetical protein